jgi:very-short-patch-repair endonuclease
MTPKSSTVEVVVGRLASSQHGVVTRAQLLAAGVTTHEIRHRVDSGALLREHWGVYRVGHRAPSVEARYLAAVLACGDEARLSGRAAAHLFGLLKGRPPAPEVTAPRQRQVAGVRVRRARIDHPDRATHRGIPVTAVPRTLIDLAADLPLDALARACHEAGVRYRTTPTHLRAALARRPTNTPGAAKLRQIIVGDARVALSALERRFLELLQEHGLPLPRTNRPAGAHHVDCRWPDRRLTVELDSYRFHHSRHAWEQDRRREREARARGEELRRYTWGDVFEEPAQTVAELRRLLVETATTGAAARSPRPPT